MRFLFAFALLIATPSLASAGNIYQFNDVAVTISGADMSKARDKAIAAAEKKAFDDLQTKLVAGGFIQQKEPVPADRITSAVDSIDVVTEKSSAKSYKATFNIVFNSVEISRIYGIGVIEATKDPEKFLVVPIVLEKGSVKLWKNDWWKNWTDNKKPDIVLPLGDLSDVQSLKNEDLAANKYEGAFKMQKRYGANNIVIVQADYVENKNSLEVQLEKIKGHDRITVNYEYPGGQGITVKDLFAAAANDIIYRLENDKLTDDSLTATADASPAAPARAQEPLHAAENNPVDKLPPTRIAEPYSPNAPGAGILGEVKYPAPAPQQAGMAGEIAPAASTIQQPAPAPQMTALVPIQQAQPLAPPAPAYAAAAQAAPVSTQPGYTDVVVTAADLIAWNRIRNKIMQTPGVNDLQIKSFTSGQANVTIGHTGDMASLKPMLLARGLNLIGDGTNWEIREK